MKRKYKMSSYILDQNHSNFKSLYYSRRGSIHWLSLLMGIELRDNWEHGDVVPPHWKPTLVDNKWSNQSIDQCRNCRGRRQVAELCLSPNSHSYPLLPPVIPSFISLINALICAFCPLLCYIFKRLHLDYRQLH